MKYRKKPVVIEAIQYTGKNVHEIVKWAWLHGVRIEHSILDKEKPSKDDYLVIPTLEGNMAADNGDFIIKGVKGEFYPCKPDIFEMTYELLSSSEDLRGKGGV